MRLFNPNATMNEVLTTNGDFNLDEIRINCKITEEFNGNFMLEATLAVSDSVFDKRVYENIVHEAIIIEQDEHGIEVFRIYDIRKNKRTIDIMCRHITISEQITMFLKDVRPTDTNGQGALTHMYNLAQCKRKEIIMTSDISNISTSYFINKNMYDALFKEDNCFVNRWGGETLRRGYNCYINSKIGQDRGVKIQSRKNLKGFEIKSNLDELTTRIIPRGFDGIEANQVDSKLINNYAQIYTKVAEYSDIKVKSENDEEGFDTLELAQEELTKRAKQQFDLFNVDKIQATYTIDFVELSRTEQYKDFILMENVEIGDTVTVKEDTYGTELKARVIKRVYSPSLRKRLETKVSNVQQEYKVISVESILKEMEELLNTTKNPSLSDYVNTMINSGLKDSYVVLKPNELLITDNKDINKAKNVTRYNKNGLGFSTTGYYGKYEYGFTIDGKINASLISTGILTAIIIQSSDGKSWWDLSNGTINLNKGNIIGSGSSWNLDTGVINFTKGLIGGLNAKFDLENGEMKFYDGNNLTSWIDKRSITQYSNGKKSVDLNNGGVDVFSQKRDNYINGGIQSLSNSSNDFLGLWHNKESISGVYHIDNNGYYIPYLTFDIRNLLNGTDGAIKLWEDIGLNGRKIFFSNGQYMESWGGDLSLNNAGLFFTRGGSSNNYIARGSDMDSQLEVLRVTRDFSATGNKKCIQISKTYGEVSYYCTEDTSSLLTDTATSRQFETKLDKNNEYTCKILIDEYVQETINTEMDYNVYIDKLSFGDYCILQEDRKKDYFIVRSDKPFKFKYKLEGRRRGFEEERKTVNKAKGFYELFKKEIDPKEELHYPEVARELHIKPKNDIIYKR